jgi:hypothetical protein
MLMDMLLVFLVLVRDMLPVVLVLVSGIHPGYSPQVHPETQ